MTPEEALRQLGFTKHEVKIYLSLLGKGPLLVSEIARATGLHRPTVYKTVEMLCSKGLIVNAPKGRRRRYAAESPERILVFFDALRGKFSEFIPFLRDKYEERKNAPLVTFENGDQAITSIYEDILSSLKRGEIFYRYSSRNDSTRGEKYLPKDYRARRDAKHLQRFVITNESIAKQKQPSLERLVKIVPKSFGLFDYNVTQLIYADKVAFVDLNTKSVLTVKNKVIAEFQKKIFKIAFAFLP